MVYTGAIINLKADVRVGMFKVQINRTKYSQTNYCAKRLLCVLLNTPLSEWTLWLLVALWPTVGK